MRWPFGFSPCPNDVFMFWAWTQGRVSVPLALEPRLADIQELNRQAVGPSALPLTKLSAAAYLQPAIQERYRLLEVGAALGRGCGPLVVSGQPWSPEHGSLGWVAVPGRDTSACRLAQAALADRVEGWMELRYDEIMPAVLAGRCQAGVIIHESRFVYQSLGLHLAWDLGAWWETTTGLPLPLGVMVARRDLPETLVAQVEQALGESLDRAWRLWQAPPDHPERQELWSALRHHAIELDPATIAAHVELYVNDFSRRLGPEGHRALQRLAQLPAASVPSITE